MEENLNNKENAVSETAAADACAIGGVAAVPTATEKRKRRFSIVMLILGIILVLYSISLVVPIVWGMLSSLKTKGEFRNNLFGLPGGWPWNWAWENYGSVFRTFAIPVEAGAGSRDVYFLEMMWYSLLYAVGCSFAATFVASIVAYLVAKFPYKFSKVVYTIVIVAMILPIVGSLPSEIQMARALGFFDHIWGLWLMKANFLGMYFLVFHGVFKNVPQEFSDAAYVDGAGNLSVLFRIVFPIVKNTFFTVLLLNFIAFWNDYQVPLIYLPNFPTAAYGLYWFTSASLQSNSNVPMRLAGCMTVLVPILVLFLFFSNRLIGNITIGGLKE